MPIPTRRRVPGNFDVCLQAFLFAASFVLLSGLLSGCSDQKVILKTGDPAPAFALTDMRGNTVKMPDGLRGKVAVIRFWSVSCKSCAVEMPLIEKVYKKYADKGLVILAVNIGETSDAVEKFLKTVDISYPVLLDPGTAVAKHYGVTAVPMTFIIDGNGIIRQKILGEAGAATFEQIVLEHLKK